MSDQPDRYAAWTRELETGKRDLKRGEVVEGWWEARTKSGRQPVVTWLDDDGDMMAKVGSGENEYGDEDFAERVFSRCKAIDGDVYIAVMEGKGWPDEVKVPPAPAQGTSDAAENPRAVIGDNQPDPHVVIAEQIAELKREVEKWLKEIGGKIASAEHDAKAKNYTKAFAKLKTSAEDARKAEKAPVLDRGRAIEAAWQPTVQAGEKAQRWAAALSTVYRTELQAAKLAEAKEKAAEGVKVRAADTKVTGLRAVATLVIDDEESLRRHTATLNTFWDNEYVRATMKRITMTALEAGYEVPGARIVKSQEAT